MSGKKEKQPPQDLSALETSYRIVGELSARDNVREYLATRIEDGADVRIMVEQAPPDDAGNALALYAADVNLLAGLDHRNLIPIYEGRWISQDHFAVVTAPCKAPTLESLVARGDSWSYPRIATILHEVNGLLEWARDQKVVHRALTLSTVHIEPDSDRVLASFVAQPLTRHGAPAAEGDARTVAQLAWTLITRGRELPQSAEDSIGIVRPELPRRVIEATDALMHGQRVGDTDPPSVPDFIATVAMTDAIMRGEVHAAELEATIYQERMLEREAWDTKERDYQEQIARRDREMAEEREQTARARAAEQEEYTQSLATEREEHAQALAAERDEFARAIAAEHDRMAEERAAMAKQMDEERARLADERAALEQQVADERKRMAEEREELVRELAREREDLLAQLAQERADLQDRLAQELKELAERRDDLERTVADEREQLARDRADHDAEIASERAAMAATIAEEREQLERRLAEERRRLETTLSEEQQRLLADRTAAETALAAARAEFEAQMTAQRQELEEQMERQRAAFEQEILTERNALDADKESFAVFNAAEREAIEGERRALEELYLAYEAEGHVVVDAEEEARADTDDAAPDRPLSVVTAALADYAPIAVPAPQSVAAAEPGEPAETDSGLTRTDAKRSRRASWGIPASVILLVGIITATAVGVGADDDRPQGEERPAAERAARPAAAPAPAAPTVIDSASGTIVTPDSISVRSSSPDSVAVAPPAARPTPPPAETPSPRAASPPSPTSLARTRPRPVTTSTERRETAAPPRSFDTAVANQPVAPATQPEWRPIPPPREQAPTLPSPPQTFPPTNMPTATPPAAQPAPRDTVPANPLPTIPQQTLPSFPTIPPP